MLKKSAKLTLLVAIVLVIALVLIASKRRLLQSSGCDKGSSRNCTTKNNDSMVLDWAGSCSLQFLFIPFEFSLVQDWVVFEFSLVYTAEHWWMRYGYRIGLSSH